MAAPYENFYERWLNLWHESQEEKKKARTVIHEEELEWIETVQDHRIALLAGPENGFRTWGSEITLAEIPPGHHTGKHEHGEEGIYIVAGKGYSVVNEVRYDWSEGSVLWMPFGSRHQHFNTGAGHARYLSFTALNLEHFAGLGRLDQWEVKGVTEAPFEGETSSDGFDALGRRIALRKEDTETQELAREDPRSPETAGLDAPVEVEFMRDDPGQGPARGAHRDWTRMYMGMTRNGRRLNESRGFCNMEIEISNAMGDAPGRHGGKHAHMEAFLYILEGAGHTIVDGQKVPWKKGSLLHVQGPQTEHQHFNDTDQPNAQLRMAPGLRFNFFQDIARERFPYLVWAGRGEGAGAPRKDPGGG